MKQVWALVWKDLQIHARSIGLQLLGWIVVMRVLAQTQHSLGLTKGQSLPSLVISGSLAIFPLFAIYSAQWLIERERGKETFAWIRALPVSDLHVVLGKFAAVLAIGVIGGVGWRIATLGIDVGLTRWQLASSWLIWWAFAGIALFCQLMFSSRLAGLTPAFLYFVMAGLAFFVSRSPDASARVIATWNQPWAHVWVWCACVGVEGVAVFATYRLFRSRDSHSLVE